MRTSGTQQNLDFHLLKSTQPTCCTPAEPFCITSARKNMGLNWTQKSHAQATVAVNSEAECSASTGEDSRRVLALIDVKVTADNPFRDNPHFG